MQKITPHLWFDSQAEEAAIYYVSIFKNSKIGAIARYGDAASKAAGRPKGSVMTVAFQLDGQDFLALNGGPVFKFSPAFSLVVKCKTQQELDEMWDKLSAGGKPGQCGWLDDKFGFSWQIVPADLEDMIQDKDTAKTERVMSALMKIEQAGYRHSEAGLRARYGRSPLRP